MIYVVSDIRCERKKFDVIMRKIKLKPEDRLYVIGDVIDRGKDGIKILLDLMKMNNAIVLLCDLEIMLLKLINPTVEYMARC